jgi:hypothetical protein
VLVRAHDHLDLILALDFVPVISSGNNDPATWAQWTDKTNQEQAIAQFQKALRGTSPARSPSSSSSRCF